MEPLIEGYVSRIAIKKTLENYYGGRSLDESDVRNTNAVKDDGISGRKLNKIMVKQAIKELSNKNVQYCIYARWIYHLPATRAAKALGVSRTTYYKLCEQGIDEIYKIINGPYAGIYDLVNEIVETN